MVATVVWGQMNLAASPPAFQPAPQADVTSIVGAPLMQADAAGDNVFLAFGISSGGPLANWSAAAPNVFQVSSATDTSSDLATSDDGSIFAVGSNNAVEIGGADLSLFSTATSAEMEQIPQRVAVPGITLHPTGALVYEPFLDGPRACRSSRDWHSPVASIFATRTTEKLRLRIYLPEPFAMLNTDVDGLHGGFLTTDEKRPAIVCNNHVGHNDTSVGERAFGHRHAFTCVRYGGGVVHLLQFVAAAFKAVRRPFLAASRAGVTFKDMNTLTLLTPALAAGAQQLVLTNPDGEDRFTRRGFPGAITNLFNP